MKLLKSSFEICEQGSGLEGIYEAIEMAGRTCYKSDSSIKYRYLLDGHEIPEDFVLLTDDGYASIKEFYDMGVREIKCTPDDEDEISIITRESTTAKGFVDKMIASKHYAMLEHGTVYLKVLVNTSSDNNDNLIELTQFYWHNPYSKRNSRLINEDEREYYITTNYRVLLENNRLSDLKYLCEPTKFHEKRVTVKFITDRGVSHEFVRHRVFSFAQESTRYCNYSKAKFGGEITFIIPSFLVKEIEESPLYEEDGTLDYLGVADDFSIVNTEEGFSRRLWYFVHSLRESEVAYFEILEEDTPQQARQVLPNALKTELVMTGFVSDWNHFFDLRAREITGKAHPDAKALAKPLRHEFIKRNLITQ